MHFPDTFRAAFEYPNRTSTTEVFTRCTSSLDLHMLIVPFRYLFHNLLVPKAATGYNSPQLRMKCKSRACCTQRCTLFCTRTRTARTHPPPPPPPPTHTRTRAHAHARTHTRQTRGRTHALFPHLHTPFPPPPSPSISLIVSMDVKHHVYLLTDTGPLKDKAKLLGAF